MKRSTKLAGLVAVVVALAGSEAFAEQGRDAPTSRQGIRGRAHAGPGFMGWKALALSEDQTRELSAVWQEHRAKVAPLRDRLRAMHGELRTLWQAERPDRGRIVAKQDVMDGIRRQIRIARTDLRLAALAVLRPEQRQQLEGRLEERRGRLQIDGRVGRGHGPRGRRGPRGRGFDPATPSQ
jgi:Spy/CpxP family protein refolding chaperone